jgi:hypothetical protein
MFTRKPRPTVLMAGVVLAGVAGALAPVSASAAAVTGTATVAATPASAAT